MDEELEIKERAMEISKDKNLFKDVFEKHTEDKKEVVKVDEAGAIVNEMHKAAIVATVKNDETIQGKIVDSAKKSVDNKLQEIQQNNESTLQKATYDANEEACKSYGINSKVPLWEIKLMKIGHSIWFVIYWIFATCTICPLMVFFNGISAFVKKSWLAIIIAVIVYLLLFVLLPILISQIPNWIQSTSLIFLL